MRSHASAPAPRRSKVVYHFLERPDAVVSTMFGLAQVAELEAELSAGIARIHAGEPDLPGFGRR